MNIKKRPRYDSSSDDDVFVSDNDSLDDFVDDDMGGDERAWAHADSASEAEDVGADARECDVAARDRADGFVVLNGDDDDDDGSGRCGPDGLTHGVRRATACRRHRALDRLLGTLRTMCRERRLWFIDGERSWFGFDERLLARYDAAVYPLYAFVPEMELAELARADSQRHIVRVVVGAAARSEPTVRISVLNTDSYASAAQHREQLDDMQLGVRIAALTAQLKQRGFAVFRASGEGAALVVNLPKPDAPSSPA